MARKPHPSSMLKTLPDETQASLFEFLRDHTLEEGVPWLFSESGVRTNKSSLGDWRKWYEMRARIDGWNSEVEQLKEILRTDESIDANLIPKIAEAVFISKAAEEGDAKTFAAVASIVQRQKELESNQAQHQDKMKVQAKKLDIQERDLQRKLKDLEAKLEESNRQRAAADAALSKAANDGGMSDETARLVREALGMKPD